MIEIDNIKLEIEKKINEAIGEFSEEFKEKIEPKIGELSDIIGKMVIAHYKGKSNTRNIKHIEAQIKNFSVNEITITRNLLFEIIKEIIELITKIGIDSLKKRIGV